MDSPSPPPSSLPASQKRRISHSTTIPLSSKKPKTTSSSTSITTATTTTTTPARKPSTTTSTTSTHPLRQASFPPPTAARKEQVVAEEEDDDEDQGRDDYGTSTVLAGDGKGGSFKGIDDDAEKAKLSCLLDAFDDDQNARYEAFRRGNLNKAAVKKLANQVLSQSVTANVGTVISGFSKVFTGEIIELALKIQKSWGEEGPLMPDHLREAWRRYKIEMHGSIGYRGAIGGGGSPVADGGGPGIGSGIGGGVGRLFR